VSRKSPNWNVETVIKADLYTPVFHYWLKPVFFGMCLVKPENNCNILQDASPPMVLKIANNDDRIPLIFISVILYSLLDISSGILRQAIAALPPSPPLRSFRPHPSQPYHAIYPTESWKQTFNGAKEYYSNTGTKWRCSYTSHPPAPFVPVILADRGHKETDQQRIRRISRIQLN